MDQHLYFLTNQTCTTVMWVRSDPKNTVLSISLSEWWQSLLNESAQNCCLNVSCAYKDQQLMYKTSYKDQTMQGTERQNQLRGSQVQIGGIMVLFPVENTSSNAF